MDGKEWWPGRQRSEVAMRRETHGLELILSVLNRPGAA